MRRSIEAVYENGVLRLKEPIALADGAVVDVTVTTRESRENKTPAQILSEIAFLPMEGSGEFSGRDHDKTLYGEKAPR